MSKREKYNTKQREFILDIIKKQNKPFTIKNIYQTLQNQAGLTTIYRLIDELSQEGCLIKETKENNTTYYQYLEKCNEINHFYLKCENCGSLTHIDCDCIKELTNHIYNKHRFTPNPEHIIINGLCQKCSKEKA